MRKRRLKLGFKLWQPEPGLSNPAGSERGQPGPGLRFKAPPECVQVTYHGRAASAELEPTRTPPTNKRCTTPRGLGGQVGGWLVMAWRFGSKRNGAQQGREGKEWKGKC
eukprot:312873-Hanusia_phi.AAC.1